MEPTELEQTRCGMLLQDFKVGVELDLNDKEFLHMMRNQYPEYYHEMERRIDS